MNGVVAFRKILKLSFEEFNKNNSFRLSAALSFYTVFLIVPVLLIVIAIAGIFFGADAVHGRIYSQINTMIGDEAALQIETIIKNIETSQNSNTSVTIGILVFIVGMSGVFTEIQDSINYLWSVKPKPKVSWGKIIIKRLLSFALIAGFGFLALISLLVSTLMDILRDPLNAYFEDATIYLMYSINVFFILVVTTCMFAIIFKVLPNAAIGWRDAFAGAFFTSVLFTVGKLLITLYVNFLNMGAIYGAAAAILIILLWIYYTSIILFFGASFTKNYAALKGEKVISKE